MSTEAVVAPLPEQPLYPTAHALLADRFPAPVYHYTDQRGFLGILKDKGIRASDLRYLNDATEYAVGYERLAVELRRRAAPGSPLEALLVEILSPLTLERVVGVNVVSFSLAGDDLSQWRAYGGGSGGFCLGFDPTTLAQRIHITGSCFGAVRYSEEQHVAIISALATDVVVDAWRVLGGDLDRQTLDTRFSLSVQLACALMKHESFVAEREWRMIVWSAFPPMVTAAMREGRGTLIPYVSVQLDYAMGNDGASAGHPLPLSSVIVGPTPHQVLAERAAALALQRAGEMAELRSSRVPFRNW